MTKASEDNYVLTVTFTQNSPSSKHKWRSLSNLLAPSTSVKGRARARVLRKGRIEGGHLPPPPPPQSLPVFVTLSRFAVGWKHGTNIPYILSIISKGYRLHFTSPPFVRKSLWEIQSPPRDRSKLKGCEISYP